MFDWEIRKVYSDLIDEYQYKIGKKTMYNVIVTELFIKTLKKRLKELNV